MLDELTKSYEGIYVIRRFPEPILNVETKWVTDFDKVEPMAKVMATFLGDKAIGLAANQVGIQQRFFVWKLKREVHLEINPRIVDFSPQSHISKEGCLSFPGAEFEILRANEITVRSQVSGGGFVERKCSGLQADLFQHEIDHLDGITPLNNINLIRVNS